MSSTEFQWVSWIVQDKAECDTARYMVVFCMHYVGDGLEKSYYCYSIRFCYCSVNFLSCSCDFSSASFYSLQV